MHEMAVTEDVLKIALRHAEKNGAKQVVRINLRIGELRDIVDEWMQRFFDYLNRDTIAAGAKLHIERSPVVFRCDCGETFPIKFKVIVENRSIPCPRCNGVNTVLFSGKEFKIQSIEVK
jgi:hydrogenase nickel incorporation protein HypA/HybF